ncbi:MAG: DUF433 domain-containing protein [Planctomycetota bacterium]|nr:DUF433 domain-containing protein [Planctomycetota bacterium]MDA1214567.1 DUF433 domain-containing protein [Planctomycetota bacterium]
MSTDTRYEHIELNDDGVPMISGTTMKVVELVLDHLAYGWSPAELHLQYPHLTLGMVHSALAYYWDHQQEIDEDIERRLKKVEEYKKKFGEPPALAKLRAHKHA